MDIFFNKKIAKLPPEITIEEIEKTINGDSNYEIFVEAINRYIENNRKRFSQAYELDDEFKNYFGTFDSFFEALLVRKNVISLALRLNFDLNYWFGSRKKKIKLYNEDVDVATTMKTYVGDCKKMSELLQSIFTKIGIDSYVMKDPHCNRNYAVHVFLVITPKDGSDEYIVDLENELRNIQSSSRTRDFGILYDIYKNSNDGRKVKKFSNSILEKIDALINYPLNEQTYVDPYGDDFLRYYKDIIPKEIPKGMDKAEYDKLCMKWIDTAVTNLTPYNSTELKGRDRLAFHRRQLAKAFKSEAMDKKNTYTCGKYSIFSVDGHFDTNNLVEYIVVVRNIPVALYKYDEESNNFVNIPVEELIKAYDNRIYYNCRCTWT